MASPTPSSISKACTAPPASGSSSACRCLVPGLGARRARHRRAARAGGWDPEATRLSAIARLLDRLGYRPHPVPRRLGRDALRQREDRALLGADRRRRRARRQHHADRARALRRLVRRAWTPRTERYFRWVSLLLTTPALFGPGWLFFRGAWARCARAPLHMDVPVALALAAGYARGAGEHRHRPRADLLRRRRDARLPAAGRPVPAATRAARGADAAELLHALAPGRGADRRGRPGSARRALRGAAARDDAGDPGRARRCRPTAW